MIKELLNYFPSLQYIPIFKLSMQSVKDHQLIHKNDELRSWNR